MHSLRLWSLVSHTVAPMHSPPTLSRYRKQAPLAHEEEGGERETVRVLLLLAQQRDPSRRADKLTLSADVNESDVCVTKPREHLDAHS